MLCRDGGGGHETGLLCSGGKGRYCSGALSERAHWPAEALRHDPRAQQAEVLRETSPRDSACSEPAAHVQLRTPHPRHCCGGGLGALSRRAVQKREASARQAVGRFSELRDGRHWQQGGAHRRCWERETWRGLGPIGMGARLDLRSRILRAKESSTQGRVADSWMRCGKCSATTGGLERKSRLSGLRKCARMFSIACIPQIKVDIPCRLRIARY